MFNEFDDDFDDFDTAQYCFEWQTIDMDSSAVGSSSDPSFVSPQDDFTYDDEFLESDGDEAGHMHSEVSAFDFCLSLGQEPRGP